MKKLIFILMMFSSFVFANQDKATDSTMAWLESVDSGHYHDSWKDAAPFLRKQVSSSNWKSTLKQTRMPLGAVKNRLLAQSNSLKDLPNAPKGDYKIYQFATEFENRPKAIEVVSLRKVENEWLVVGYFIQ